MKELDQRDQPKTEKEKPRKSEFMFCAVWCSASKPCESGPCPHGLEGLVNGLKGLVKRDERV